MRTQRRARRTASRNEGGHRLARLGAGHAVQVELVLHHPVTAPQLAQHLPRQAVAEERRLLAGLERALRRRARAIAALGERRVLVEQRLDGDAESPARRRAWRGGSAQRHRVAHRRAEERGVVVVRRWRDRRTLHGATFPQRLSRYFSASSAAMQPEPALVTA